MKKTLVVLLILAVTSGAFAQITPFGNVRLDFGATINSGDNNDYAPKWNFGLSGDATNFGVRVGDDDAGGEVLIRYSTDVRANGWVNIGPVQLKVGNGEFFGQWGSAGVWGHSGYGFGCSALGGQNPYIQVGAQGFVAGLAEGGVSGKYLATSADTKSPAGQYLPFPAFFAGYDMTIDGVASFGAMFAGQFVGERYEDAGTGDKDGKFPLMFNVHGKLLMLDPITIGLNVGFYLAPSHAPALFVTAGNPAVGPGGKSTVLEAMVDFCIPLDPCTIGISAALVTDLASKSDGGGGSAFQIAAGANFGIGETGFYIVPGLIFTNISKLPGGADGKNSTFDLGVSLGYSF